jgi:hypothetical protein
MRTPNERIQSRDALTHGGRWAWAVALLGGCAVVTVACSASPASPTTTVAPGVQPSVTPAAASAGEMTMETGSANLTPADFATRGWECRPSPAVPGRMVCSPPHQGFPPVPPTDDRPAVFKLLAWQNGVFDGTLLLVRTDLYHGQRCESWDGPYIFRPVIGYYECLYTVGR